MDIGSCPPRYRGFQINTRRTALTLSAAGGGLLAVAFIHTAVVHADGFNSIPDPTFADSPASFTALGGLPPFDQTVGATLEYNVVNASTGEAAGNFLGVSSQDQDLFGLSTHEILATQAIPGADLPAHSLFSTTDVLGIQNVYSDVVGTGTGGSNTVTDTLVTPLGDVNVPISFNAAAALPAAEFTAPAGSAFDPGDIFAATGTESYQSISALPLDQTISGTAGYVVETAAGKPTEATFQGVSFHDVSAFSPSDQEILVASSSVGGGPADGSIFNTVDYGNGFENVYSDVIGTGTNPTHTITDTVVTPFGDYNMPSSFDASAAYQPVDFSQPAVGTDAGYAFTASGAENYTAIDTNPLFDQSVSGTQNFVGTGAYDGSFTGTVTNTVDSYGATNQEILVTDAGTGAPADGSIFETTNFGSGFANIYTDILGTTGGTGTVTDTLVTPLGDVNVPVFFDASSALPFAELIAPGGTAAVGFSGLLTDLTSALDLGSFLTF